MKAKPPKGKPGGSEPTPGATADDLPERWSVQRKMELVLRLLRGEALDAVSRESQVPAHELESWKRGSSASSRFSCSGTAGMRLPAGTAVRRPLPPATTNSLHGCSADLQVGEFGNRIRF